MKGARGGRGGARRTRYMSGRGHFGVDGVVGVGLEGLEAGPIPRHRLNEVIAVVGEVVELCPHARAAG